MIIANISANLVQLHVEARLARRSVYPVPAHWAYYVSCQVGDALKTPHKFNRPRRMLRSCPCGSTFTSPFVSLPARHRFFAIFEEYP
jgi:hypothetical protein